MFDEKNLISLSSFKVSVCPSTIQLHTFNHDYEDIFRQIFVFFAKFPFFSQNFCFIFSRNFSFIFSWSFRIIFFCKIFAFSISRKFFIFSRNRLKWNFENFCIFSWANEMRKQNEMVAKIFFLQNDFFFLLEILITLPYLYSKSNPPPSPAYPY